VTSAEQLWNAVRALPGRGPEALGVLNGLFGDALLEQGSPLAVPLTIRDAAGEVLSFDRAVLRRQLPAATGRICVLVHGLMASEIMWRAGGELGTDYGSRLADDHGVTPVYVRYNSGRHISTNGRELATALQALVAAWPVRVREIDLIGHSMGGLVIRSACHYGAGMRPRRLGLPIRRPWPSKVRRIVLLGVPNTGAPLEMLATITSAALWAMPVPWARAVGLGLDQRSDGIKDLRFGAIRDEEWQEQDPDARVRPVPHQIDTVRRARHLIVVGSLTADPDHPIARVMGDALVTSASATGMIDAAADGDEHAVAVALFPDATVCLLPRMAHNTLIAHDDVYREIDQWWDHAPS
jgi:pimeloyl-ACP methyl ester carboxylesterase